MNVFQERLLTKKRQFSQQFVDRHPDNWEELIDILSPLITGSDYGDLSRVGGASPDNTHDMPHMVCGECVGGKPFGRYLAITDTAPQSVSHGHSWMSLAKPTAEEVESYFQASMFIASRLKRLPPNREMSIQADSNTHYKYERIRGALQYLGHSLSHELVEMSYTLWTQNTFVQVSKQPIHVLTDAVLHYSELAQRYLDEIKALDLP